MCQGGGDLGSPQPLTRLRDRDCFVPLDAAKMRRGVLAMTEGGCVYVMTNNDVDYLMTPLIHSSGDTFGSQVYSQLTALKAQDF